MNLLDKTFETELKKLSTLRQAIHQLTKGNNDYKSFFISCQNQQNQTVKDQTEATEFLQLLYNQTSSTSSTSSSSSLCDEKAIMEQLNSFYEKRKFELNQKQTQTIKKLDQNNAELLFIQKKQEQQKQELLPLLEQIRNLKQPII